MAEAAGTGHAGRYFDYYRDRYQRKPYSHGYPHLECSVGCHGTNSII